MAKPRESYLELSRRPVYCLIFLAPLLIGYEIGVLVDHRSLLAEQMLRDFLTLRGRTFNFLSGMFVLAVMVAWQIGGAALGDPVPGAGRDAAGGRRPDAAAVPALRGNSGHAQFPASAGICG